MRKQRKAFTIVELVIVIAVIAILAAVLIPTFSGVIRRAKVSSDEQTAAPHCRKTGEQRSCRRSAAMQGSKNFSAVGKKRRKRRSVYGMRCSSRR